MTFNVSDFEKLGVFYLGRRYSMSKGAPTDELFLYDSKDLLTHAVCIGMTGSGKTGLCLDLIEEAALDGVPVIAIDPKGDISDLLLTFPSLSKEEILPWVSEEDARRAGQSIDEFACAEAQRWRQGLSEWGEDGERIARLKQSAEFAIYTPGSTAGLPVSIVGSLEAPPEEIIEDADALRERINSTARPLLAMLAVDTDPLRSREHILLATILDKTWRAGKNITLNDLIQLIQKPPVTTVGALDLESFFPAKERFAFAMSINNLIAAPGFDVWLSGEPMSVDRFFYTENGRPKISIFSIAHLSDAERMFFVTLLLGQIVSWMRTQSGTTSLRAILYMDEIFGFFPPVKNPPSKLPLLTLLKQARAFGIGVVLASQNPVDLDYKGLSNAGTWFIGRLQTERDKMRVLDGLEGAAAEVGSQFDRQKMEQTLASLSRRIFLVNNVHADHQEIIETRWTLSYLRGPLTKAQIKKLMHNSPTKISGTVEAARQLGAKAQAQREQSGESSPASTTQFKPSLPPEVPEHFLGATAHGDIVYKPMVAGAVAIRFVEPKVKLDQSIERVFLVEPKEGALPVDWSEAKEQRFAINALKTTAPEPGSYLAIPPAASKAANYKVWAKDLCAWTVAYQKFFLLQSPSTGEYSQMNETEKSFRIRLNDAAARKRDEAMSELRTKYEPKVHALEERMRQAQQQLHREQDEERELEAQTAISIGATVFGAITGRRTLGRASTAAKSATRVAQQKQEVERAEETVMARQQRYQELQDELTRELTALKAKFDMSTESFTTATFTPKKTNVQVRLVALVWAPYVRGADGTLLPAWERLMPAVVQL